MRDDPLGCAINRSVDQTLSSVFQRTLSFHVDGWRANVLPGVWLPSYVYCEETDLRDAKPSSGTARFKSQVRFWGYEAQAAERTRELTTIRIDEPTIVDATAAGGQLSPVLSQRRWEQEAETNVIERLEKVGLLSPPGEVDTVLETVMNNLVVTNPIVLERPLRCRILLTAPLESFTVGRTIVLSRGLIDVLPDEGSLAVMLAHELGHVVLGHPLIDTKFAFADRLMVSDADLLETLQFHRSARDEAAADDRVVEMLRKSPYKDRLSATGLFLRMIAQRAPPAAEADSAPHRRSHRGWHTTATIRATDGPSARPRAAKPRSDSGAAARRAHRGRSVERPALAGSVSGRTAGVTTRESAVRRHAVDAVYQISGAAGCARGFPVAAGGAGADDRHVA